jgi:hypothetical protein
MEQRVNVNFVSNSDQQLQVQVMGLELFMKINTYLLLRHVSGLRDSEKGMMNWTMIKGIGCIQLNDVQKQLQNFLNCTLIRK